MIIVTLYPFLTIQKPLESSHRQIFNAFSVLIRNPPLRGGIEWSRPSSSECGDFYSLDAYCLPLLLSSFDFSLPIFSFKSNILCFHPYNAPTKRAHNFSWLTPLSTILVPLKS